MYNETQKRTIIQLNDQLRTTFAGVGGRVVISQHISRLSPQIKNKIFNLVKSFNAFNPELDNNDLHEQGKIPVVENGLTINFNIEYAERNVPYISYGSEDPSNPKITTRILAISLEDDDTAQVSQNWVVIYPENEL